MNKILLDEKDILIYIRDMLESYKRKFSNVNFKYNHNTTYENAISICEFGILSMIDQQKKGIINYSNNKLNLMADIDSHPNGIDNISLSIVGLPDLYRNEMVYDPYNPNYVNFIISNDIKAFRRTFNYGNEFIFNGSIPIDKFRAIDIRLLELIENNKFNNEYNFIIDLIKKYNCLKYIALNMKKNKLDIPLREMSFDVNYDLDIDKIEKMDEIVLKKDVMK